MQYLIGEPLHGKSHTKRLYALNTHILHTAAYVYYPKRLMLEPAMGERLRWNTERVAYTLDVPLTLWSIYKGS